MVRMKLLGMELGGWIAAASVVLFSFAATDVAMADIASSKHNLSTSGTGTVKSSGTEICVFCHTPHGGNTGASAPLWNRGVAATTSFTLYDGLWGDRPSTFDGSGEGMQPVGTISALCLSCHDGATALDLLINAPGSGGYNASGASAGYTWTGAGTGGVMPAGITNIGSDLKNDHPISVPYCGGKATGALGGPESVSANCKDKDFRNAATSGGLFWVDSTGGTTGTREKTDMILYVRNFASSGNWASVECGSCHDPHSSNATFLRTANTGSQVCLTCHVK